MRRTFAWVVGLAVAAGAIGCGDKSGGGSFDPKSPVGVWTMDTKPLVEMMKPMVEGMKKMAEMMPDGEEKTKALKEAESKIADMGKMKVELTLKQDGTASFDAEMPGEPRDIGTGTWTQKGETVTIVQTSKNGKPTAGSSAEPKALTFKDGKLLMTEEKMSMTFIRK